MQELYRKMIDETIGETNYNKVDDFINDYFKLIELNNNKVKNESAYSKAKDKLIRSQKVLFCLIYPFLEDYERVDYWKEEVKKSYYRVHNANKKMNDLYDKLYSSYKSLNDSSTREKLNNVNIALIDDQNKINESLLVGYVIGNKLEVANEIMEDYESFLINKELYDVDNLKDKRDDLHIRNCFVNMQKEIVSLCEGYSNQEIDKVFDYVYDSYELLKKSFNGKVDENELSNYRTKLSKLLYLDPDNKLIFQMKDYSLLSLRVIDKETGKIKKR